MARVRVTCSEAAAVNLSVDVTQTAVQNGRYDTLLAGFDTFDCHAGGQNRLVPIAGGPRLRVGDANVVVEAIIRDELDSSSVRHEQEIAAIAAPPPRVDRPSESITINAVRRRVIDDEVRFFVDVTCRRQITVGVSISVTQLIGRRQHRVLGGGNQPCDGDTRVELSLGSPLDEGLIAGRAMISVTAAPTPQGRAPMDVASAWRRTRLPIPIPAAPAA